MHPLEIRQALDGDYETFTELFPELGVDDPVTPMEVWSTTMRPSTWIALERGDAVGYCYCQSYADTGYVRHVVVAPRARGRGVGRALLTAVAAHLRRGGQTTWRLNVRPNNTAARRLYERMGFTVAYESVALRLPWDALSRLPAGCAEVRPFGPEDDGHVESTFALPAGQLATARAAHRVLLLATDASARETTGLAVFDPGFPGAFPFRVVEPDALEPLLRAMRTHARPSDTFVALVTEDDAALAQRLVALGAIVRDEILHMSGSIPTTD